MVFTRWAISGTIKIISKLQVGANPTHRHHEMPDMMWVGRGSLLNRQTKRGAFGRVVIFSPCFACVIDKWPRANFLVVASALFVPCRVLTKTMKVWRRVLL